MTDFEFRTLTPQDAVLDKAVALYERSFPEWERRDTIAWLEMLRGESGMVVEAIIANGNFAGFISWWNLSPGVVYVEHFAIEESRRGCGMGGRVIDELIRRVAPAAVLLEVEPMVQSPVAAARIEFYRRHGFHLIEGTGYVQPPYRDGGDGGCLDLMATDGGLDVASAIKSLKTLVYGVKNNA